MQSTYEIMVVSHWGRKSKQMAERMVKFSKHNSENTSKLAVKALKCENI